jgi:hypothetical protein
MVLLAFRFLYLPRIEKADLCEVIEVLFRLVDVPFYVLLRQLPEIPSQYRLLGEIRGMPGSEVMA